MSRQQQAFGALARLCPGCPALLGLNDILKVAAPWLSGFLAEPGNVGGFLEVTDAGQANGLCNPKGHQGIDVYLGEGQTGLDTWVGFNSIGVNQHEVYGEIWWPIYHHKK